MNERRRLQTSLRRLKIGFRRLVNDFRRLHVGFRGLMNGFKMPWDDFRRLQTGLRWFDSLLEGYRLVLDGLTLS